MKRNQSLYSNLLCKLCDLFIQTTSDCVNWLVTESCRAIIRKPTIRRHPSRVPGVKYILSFSGGKDSTFLLLELIRRGYPLDEVVFFDTGWEFPAMYEHIERCKQLCKRHGITFVTLYPKKPFDYWMFDHETRSGKRGYSWCGGPCRWGTTLKLQALDLYAEDYEDAIVYIGIAADEPERLEREFADYKRFPLADWGVTEEECLLGCYDAGFDWGGMYERLDRLSCKFCKNKNLKELRNIRHYYPDVWEELKYYQTRTDRPYKGEGKDVFDLDRRFAIEDRYLASGQSITSRQFYEIVKGERKDA